MEKNMNEKFKLYQIIDNWDLNRISPNQLTIEKKLASGGQGKIKLGKYHNMSVIIKILHDLNARDYTNEVINLYKYRHPNIPKFLGIFDSEKDFGVVIEHIDGMTVSKMINLEKSGKLKIPFLVKIDYLIQLASVIEFLHDNQLIHRDLKPGNIIVDHLGKLFLLDFGIAIPESQNEIDMETHDFCLTPTYIPPEIALQAQKIGEEEDLMDEDEDISINSRLSLQSTNSAMSFGRSFSNIIKDINSDQELAKTQIGLNLSLNNHSKMLLSSKIKRKIIKVTNKYDVWTFGVIMSEIFTRCAPWAKSEKDKVLDYQITALILKNRPFPIGKIIPENNPNEEELKKIIKKCTFYDESLRPGIKEIKNDLLQIFRREVETNAKEIKYQVLKNLNTVHQGLRQALDKTTEESKRSLVRMNKMIYQRKNFNLESINNINLKLNLHTQSGINLDSNCTGDFNLILSEHMKQLNIITNKQSDPKCIAEIDNSLMEGLKKINLKKGQNIKILEHKKRELMDKISHLNNKLGLSKKFQIDGIDLLNLGNQQQSIFKKYFYMNYDDFNAKIIVHEFPKKLSYTVDLENIKKDLNYRNPFCLNWENKLFMIGGLIISTGAEKSFPFQELKHNIQNKKFYSELFGNNYLPTNLCFFYDAEKKRQKILPQLLHPRNNHSCIIFKQSYLWVIGGDTKSCEVLDIKTTSLANKLFHIWASIFIF
jgi:serine/threonine protein kinase